MKAPPRFKGRWRSEWETIATQLEEQASHTPADLDLLSRLIDNRIHAVNALETAGLEPFVAGSTGQLTEHPGFKVAARCDGVAISLARQLRITPFTRGHIAGDEMDGDALAELDELAERRRGRAA